MASVRGHPFIVRLAFAFHTRDSAFLVSEFMAGGDLFTLMRWVCFALLCLAFLSWVWVGHTTLDNRQHQPLTLDQRHCPHH